MKFPLTARLLIFHLLLPLGLPLLMSQAASAVHGKSHLENIEEQVKEYGTKTMIDRILMMGNCSITIEHEGVFVGNYQRIPDEKYVNADTIARDLRRLRVDLNDFEHRLQHLPVDPVASCGKMTREGIQSEEVMKKLFLKNREDQERRNRQVDSGIQRDLKTMKGVSKKLHYAAGKVHHKSVSELLEKGADPNYSDTNGFTPLMVVAGYSQYSTGVKDPLEVARLLLNNGAEINTENRHKETALTFAIQNGRVDMVELLVQHGAQIQSEAGSVIRLVDTNRVEMLQYLARAGVSLEHRLSGLTPLLWNLKLHSYRYPNMASLLLELGADACVADDHQQTALMWSLKHPDLQVLKTILNRCGKEELLARSQFGATVMHWATRSGSVKKTALLIEAGGDVNVKGQYERTPLHGISANEYKERVQATISIAKLFLEAGADINVTDSRGNTPLIIAAEYGFPEYIGFLVEQGADLSPMNKSKRSAAHVMASKGRSAALQKIMRLKSQEGDRDVFKDEPTPLIVEAITRNNPETAMVLIDGGADIEKRNNRMTPLMAAASWTKSHDVAKRLIELGADVNALDARQNTALWSSIFHGNFDTTLLLLKNGVDINLPNRNGEIGLHWAAQFGDVEVVETLLGLKTNLDHQAKNGSTPLMEARSLEVARLLVKRGANHRLKDARGRTALDRAVTRRDTAMADFFRSLQTGTP